MNEKLFCYLAKTGDAYRLIAQIPFRMYLATTYDMFIEDAYLLANGHHLPKFYETSIDGAKEVSIPLNPETPETLEIFICYEFTTEDKKLLKDLKTRLKVIQIQHQISIESSDEVSAGLEKEPKVEHILCRHDEGARVIPIILRPCSWNETEYGKLEPAPTRSIFVRQAYYPDITMNSLELV